MEEEEESPVLSALKRQQELSQFAVREGRGQIIQSAHGAFVVFSRASLNTVLWAVRRVKPIITALTQLKTVFLLGPTPTFFGEQRATTSWRRDFVRYLDQSPAFNSDYLIVLPEPYDCDWSSVNYEGLTSDEQVYAQIHWETHFIDLALITGVIVLHAHFRWAGNAGPTARFEAGKLLDRLDADRVNHCVINLPRDSQSVPYLMPHLMAAQAMLEQGRFALTECSPLVLNEKNEPVRLDGALQPSGLYEDGSCEPDTLLPFFHAIETMAISLNREYRK